MNQCEYLYTPESLASKETLHDDALAAERSSSIFLTVTRPLSPTYRIRSLQIISALCEGRGRGSMLALDSVTGMASLRYLPTDTAPPTWTAIQSIHTPFFRPMSSLILDNQTQLCRIHRCR